MQRPSNWYIWDYDQQREWERRERDFEAEKSRCRTEKDELEDQVAAERSRANKQTVSYLNEMRMLGEELDEVRDELDFAEEFIAKHGLAEEYKKEKNGGNVS